MYRNGEVPLSKLIHVQNNIWLPAGTLARWNWAVEQGVQKYGIRLRITGQNSTGVYTWNGYRPLSAQKVYRTAFGNLAASPGYSSHGGTYRGQEVFAIDVDNWAEMGWARFSALMRLAGLTVDFVSPREQWHVGDFNNPWIVPAFASGAGGSHLNPIPKEDDMAVEDVYVEFKKKGGQAVPAGKVVNLHINDAKDISVLRGAAKSFDGDLVVEVEGGAPYAGAFQITPIVRTVRAGQPDVIASLRARETIFTGGRTYAHTSVHGALQAGQRLSFQIGGSAQAFKVVSATFRGKKIT